MPIVSSDAYNRSAIRTVVCVVLTTNLRLAEAPGNVLAAGGERLPYDSVVNVSQVVTLDEDDLGERIGPLDWADLRRVDDGLRRVLSLATA